MLQTTRRLSDVAHPFASVYTLNCVKHFRCTVVILYIFFYSLQRAKKLLLYDINL